MSKRSGGSRRRGGQVYGHMLQYSVDLFYWYKSTNSDAGEEDRGAEAGAAGGEDASVVREAAR
jgi:hypothetical protein